MEDRTIVNDIHNGSTQSSLACKSCRRKKLRCDRTIPQCRVCSKASRDCEYPTEAQRPGPRPGSHRRTNVSGRARPADRRRGRSTQEPTVDDNPMMDTQGPGESAVTHARRSGLIGASSLSSSLRRMDTVSQPSLPPMTTSPFTIACIAMRMPEKSCLDMIDVYFANMTSFCLFHQPTFLAKVADIKSPQQVQALLSSMLAFATRFMHADDSTAVRNARTAEVLEQARVLNEQCLQEYLDETPPLHLLQSSLIVALLVTATGVRGRSWRLVGQCIRFAYELRLHELDPETDERSGHSGPELNVDAPLWTAAEEKRRAWWAAWECDVFSSTIQRLPTAIDWSRNHTNLPSSDEAWFAGQPARSCWLHLDPNRRWKDMRDCGNTSPHAWFLLLDSYKWEALMVNLQTSARTALGEQANDLREFYDEQDYKPPLLRRREMLENCLRCALSAVPASLQFHGGYLAFVPAQNGVPNHTLCRDHGTYSIELIVQVAQMLLCRADVRGSQYIYVMGGLVREKGSPPPVRDALQDPSPTVPLPSAPSSSSSHHASTRRRWQLCLFAADRIASVVRHSSPAHPRACNPNMSTALWMAAATQITALTLYRDEIDAGLAQSNLDLLAAAMADYVAFWNGPEALVQSLPALRRHLETLGGARGGGGGGGGEGSFLLQLPPPPPPTRTAGLPPTAAVDQTPAHVRDTATAAVTAPLPRSRMLDGYVQTRPAGQVASPPTAVDALALMHHQDNNDDGNDDSSGMVPELTAFDVLQAMDFGAVYNGVENWESLFLDPMFQPPPPPPPPPPPSGP